MSYITVFSRGEKHIGNKWSIIKFKITEELKLGNTFIRSGNMIKVNKNLNGVVASATMNLTSDSYSYSGDLYIYQYRNGSVYKGVECRSIAGSGLKTMHATPTLFNDVKDGDEFCFGHYTGSDSDTFST